MNIYRLVLDEVERPLLELMMRYTHGNQSKAAQCMGINRATLRTKLKRHNLL
jgi:Fis family transcriptional regulator